VTVDLTGLLEQACRTRDALQVEIDAAIDRHGVICRFIDGMSGPAEPPPTVDADSYDEVVWQPAERQQAQPEQFAIVDAAPPKAKPAAARKPRQGGTDWPAVFDWVKTAKADGTYSLKLLIEEFGTPAKNWRAMCANRGLVLDDNAPAPAPALASVPVTPVDNSRRTFSPDDATDLLDAM